MTNLIIKNKVKVYVSIILIVFQSCKNEEKVIEEKIAKCVNESTNFLEYNKSGQGDFYTMIEEIEDVFISSNKLKNLSKIEYREMIVELLSNGKKDDKSFYDDIYKVYDKYGYTPSVNNYKVFNDCPFSILVTEKHEMKSSLFFQSQSLSGLQADGFRDVGLIKELISLTSEEDFEKIVFRASIVLVCVSSLDNIYGESHPVQEDFDFSR